MQGRYPLGVSQPGLLEVLDAMVRSDRGAPGFSGRIAIGLRSDPARWWVVELGAHAECGFVEKMPAAADAWLALGTTEANAILGLGEMPEPAAVVTAGDKTLIERFCRRYIRSLSLLDIRSRPEV